MVQAPSSVEPRELPLAEPSLLRQVRRPGPLVAISLVYLIGATAIMIWRGISVSPDYLLLLMVPVALLAGRLIRYLKDWVPFIAIFLGWEAMRGIVPKLDVDIHIADLANFETTLFGGHLPTQVLQQMVGPGALRTVALIATIIYFCHFVFPLGVGLVLWLVDRTQFLRYTTSLMGMAFAAFIIFLLFPTAPPWYAQDNGSLCCFQHALHDLLPSAVSPYYQSLNPNPTAAFPSLHAAFPFLSFLALRRTYPRASWLALVWCVAVWFSVVFLGEHYVVDVVAGVLLAALTWLAMMRLVVPRVSMLKGGPMVVEPLASASTVAARG